MIDKAIQQTFLKGTLEVYRCESCYDDDAACGFNGASYDHAYDECHHPLTREEARRIAACWNACMGQRTEELVAKYRKEDKCQKKP